MQLKSRDNIEFKSIVLRLFFSSSNTECRLFYTRKIAGVQAEVSSSRLILYATSVSCGAVRLFSLIWYTRSSLYFINLSNMRVTAYEIDVSILLWYIFSLPLSSVKILLKVVLFFSVRSCRGTLVMISRRFYKDYN